MILIVDSGGTRTEWRSVDNEGVVRLAQTAGMNPSCHDGDHFASVVNQAMRMLNPEGERVDKIYFYGAGLLSPQSVAPIRVALERKCPYAFVDFRSDLLAAARALFGDGDGIVAIMGTGSNSCHYSEGNIVRRYGSGGFILGDEGSGAALGKAFISDYIKCMMPSEVYDAFEAKYSLQYKDIVENVYQKPGASAYLGAFAPYILENINEPTGYLRALVDDCIDSFVKRALSRYEDSGCRMLKVGVVGSFGYACSDRIRDIGGRYGLEFVKFLKSPIDELVKYHCHGI